VTKKEQKAVDGIMKLAGEYEKKKKEIEDKIIFALKESSLYEMKRHLREIRFML